jgi:Na+/melibiose symporter-like transporter
MKKILTAIGLAILIVAAIVGVAIGSFWLIYYYPSILGVIMLFIAVVIVASEFINTF